MKVTIIPALSDKQSYNKPDIKKIKSKNGDAFKSVFEQEKANVFSGNQ